MGAYSKDLRLKVLAAVDRGVPRREVVGTFGVSLAALKRWLGRRKEGEDLAPRPSPGRTPRTCKSAEGAPRPAAAAGGEPRGDAGGAPRVVGEARRGEGLGVRVSLEPKDPLSGFWADSPPEDTDKPRYRKRFCPGVPITRSADGRNYLEQLPITGKSLP